MITIPQLIWIVLAYLLGALPLSVWVGRMAGKDIRQFGDGNPGATNVLRAAGWRWFILALILDICKSAIPVGLAYQIFGWQEWIIAPIAFAPSLGHAFSPFLRWQGGKALATMLGSWIGLTLWVLPTVAVVSLLLLVVLIKGDIWSLLGTITTMLLYLVFFWPDPIFILIQLLQLALVLWAHWPELYTPPSFKFANRP